MRSLRHSVLQQNLVQQLLPSLLHAAKSLVAIQLHQVSLSQLQSASLKLQQAGTMISRNSHVQYLRVLITSLTPRQFRMLSTQCSLLLLHNRYQREGLEHVRQRARFEAVRRRHGGHVFGDSLESC